MAQDGRCTQSVPAETSTINPQVVIKARELQANKIPKINNKILINSPWVLNESINIWTQLTIFYYVNLNWLL